MQALPWVTVICLCYNQQDYVLETLNSVLAQSYKNIEIIIVDDFSTDNSVKVIERWLIKNPNVLFIKNDRNLGNTKSFNLAVHKSKGSFLIDLACDDLLFENTVKSQISNILQTDLDHTAFIYANAINIDQKGDFISYFFPVDSNKKVLKKRNSGNIYSEILAGGSSICSVTALHNRKVFEKLDGYDETLFYEDLDYWIRASRTYKIYYTDEIWVKKRYLKNSLGASFAKKDLFAHKLSISTYYILKKALKLNQSKTEDTALLKRIHYELHQNTKKGEYLLLIKLLLLKTKLHLLTLCR